MKLNALAENPTFDLKAEVKIPILFIERFFKSLWQFDVDRGTFSLYTEIAAKGGKFKGYVKPIIKDLKVLGPKDKKRWFFPLIVGIHCRHSRLRS